MALSMEGLGPGGPLPIGIPTSPDRWPLSPPQCGHNTSGYIPTTSARRGWGGRRPVRAAQAILARKERCPFGPGQDRIGCESRESGTTMAATMARDHPQRWTQEERARETRARELRARQDQLKTPEQRLEETLRVSRLIGELRAGAARDVPGR